MCFFYRREPFARSPSTQNQKTYPSVPGFSLRVLVFFDAGNRCIQSYEDCFDRGVVNYLVSLLAAGFRLIRGRFRLRLLVDCRLKLTSILDARISSLVVRGSWLARSTPAARFFRLHACRGFVFFEQAEPVCNCERSSSTFKKCSLKANLKTAASKSALGTSLFLIAHRSFSSAVML